MSMPNSSEKENKNVERERERERERKKLDTIWINLYIIQCTKNQSDKIIMALININLLWNKCGTLRNSVTEIIDKLMISGTKLADTFPHALCHLKVFSKSI